MSLVTGHVAAPTERDAPGWIVSCQQGLKMLMAIGCLSVGGCGPQPNGGQDLVIAATGEPSVLVPPLIGETVGRDIADLVYERLAQLRVGGSPIDTAAFATGLASSWSRRDSLTWVFTLRSGATWHDGQAVTADDVIFSFAAYVDTALGTPESSLEGVQVIASGSGAVAITFPRAYAEQLFDATYHVRIMPRHIWDSIPRSQWGADTSLALLVGSGPYRIGQWTRGQSLIAERVRGAGFQRVAWRFSGDQDAALNLALAGEADVLETVTSPSARERAARDTTVTAVPYASAVIGYLGFRLEDPAGRPHPVLGDRLVRQALGRAIDRPALIRAVVGPDAAVPPGPMSRASWIWDDSIRTLSYDPAEAGRLLDLAGWRAGPNGARRRSGLALTVDLLVPSSSTTRRQLAEGIQQLWKQVGIEATITAVDFPVFQERLAKGQFDAMVGAWLDNPSPRNLGNQWTREGFGGLNYSRYHNPVFDSLFRIASSAHTLTAGRSIWREALDTLNVDAPAIFLYTPTNVAVVSRRVSGLSIDPFSWLSAIGGWSKSN